MAKEQVRHDNDMVDLLLPEENAIDGQYIIKVRQDADEAALDVLLREFGATGSQLEDSSILHCSSGPLSRDGQLFPGVARIGDVTLITASIGSEVSLNYIRTKPEIIEYVQQDERIALADESCTSQSGSTWGIDHVDPDDEYRDGAYKHDANGGEGVNAYILDTGIYTAHTNFQGRAIWGATYCSSTPCQDEADIHGHGTHVAGTVGADVYGIARGVTLVAVKVLNDNGSGSWSSVIAGVQWSVSNAQSQNRRGVINMSLGGGANSALNAAVAAAYSQGVVVVVAAGNENTDACSKSPASEPTAITVGAHTSINSRAWFSNYGTCVDLFGPGDSITSLDNVGSGTIVLSGTSMASPHVAGVAAQLLSRNPTASPSAVNLWILLASVNNVLTGVGSGSPNEMLQQDFCKDSTTPCKGC